MEPPVVIQDGRDWFATVTAVLSLLISSGAAASQTVMWRRTNATRVEANVWAYAFSGRVLVISLNLVNHSGHPVRVRRIAIAYADGQQEEILKIDSVFDAGQELLKEIPARDGVSDAITSDVLDQHNITVSRPIRASVRISTGKEFWSKPVTIAEDP